MTRSDLPDPRTIRECLERSSRGPLKAKELAKELDVPTGAYRAFRDRLREMERRGELYRNRGQRYAVPSTIHLVVGELRLTRGGDGFLKPDDPRETDVFVPARSLESAMDGDRVAVRVEGRPGGDRAPVGRVVKVLERARPTLVGTFRASRGFGFVSPLDRRISQDVMVPEGHEGEASDGDVVVVRIHQFGSAKRNAVGEVELVLGPADDPGVDVLAILHGHGLPRAFPDETEAAAADAARRMERPGPREDLRDLLVFTIDPADAKDHDDALSLQPVSKGVWEVGIHIADVSHFVEEGSPVDLEAFRRATSVYLVDQVVPMLPHALSSDLCSLKRGEDRLALSLFVTLDEQGRVREHRYAPTWIRSHHGLDYGQVQGVLEGTSSVESELDDVLRTLSRLAGVLREKRGARGSLDFDLPEARVELDEEGIPVDIQRVVQLESHRLIEDFMLLANELVAQDAVARALPVPFRVHEPPLKDRLEDLREFLQSVGHSLPKKSLSPRHLQAVLDRVKGKPEESLVSTVILRSMSRARYDEVNQGHFGLASAAYLHFTSPIRRYPDLLVHRVVRRALIGGEAVPESWEESLPEMAEHCSEQERRAQQAERDSIEMKKIEYMRRHLGDEFDGTVAGVTSFGFFVLLDQVFVEGLVHVSNLDDDFYTFVQEAYALVGERTGRRFRLGDRVRVKVARADKEERQIDFLVLDGTESGRGRAARTGQGGKGSRSGRRGGRKK